MKDTTGARNKIREKFQNKKYFMSFLS